MSWTLTNTDSTKQYSSASQPVWDRKFLSWKCTDTNNNAFSIFDGTGKNFTIKESKTVDEALADLAALRYTHECAGVYYQPSTATEPLLFESGEISQAKLTAALLAVIRNTWQNGAWKTASGGFVTLTDADVTAIAEKVHDYVQKCFDNEDALATKIRTDPNTDTSVGWPSQH